jgi:hypothetical protein
MPFDPNWTVLLLAAKAMDDNVADKTYSAGTRIIGMTTYAF